MDGCVCVCVFPLRSVNEPVTLNFEEYPSQSSLPAFPLPPHPPSGEEEEKGAAENTVAGDIFICHRECTRVREARRKDSSKEKKKG